VWAFPCGRGTPVADHVPRARSLTQSHKRALPTLFSFHFTQPHYTLHAAPSLHPHHTSHLHSLFTLHSTPQTIHHYVGEIRGRRRSPGQVLVLFRARTERGGSLLTTYWSESTTSTRCLGWRGSFEFPFPCSLTSTSPFLFLLAHSSALRGRCWSSFAHGQKVRVSE
jgi:hypothetical protein